MPKLRGRPRNFCMAMSSDDFLAVDVVPPFIALVFSVTTIVTMSPMLRALRSWKSVFRDVSPGQIEPGEAGTLVDCTGMLERSSF
jgi:hypothetical protein